MGVAALYLFIWIFKKQIQKIKTRTGSIQGVWKLNIKKTVLEISNNLLVMIGYTVRIRGGGCICIHLLEHQSYEIV